MEEERDPRSKTEGEGLQIQDGGAKSDLSWRRHISSKIGGREIRSKIESGYQIQDGGRDITRTTAEGFQIQDGGGRLDLNDEEASIKRKSLSQSLYQEDDL